MRRTAVQQPPCTALQVIGSSPGGKTRPVSVHKLPGGIKLPGIVFVRPRCETLPSQRQGQVAYRVRQDKDPATALSRAFPWQQTRTREGMAVPPFTCTAISSCRRMSSVSASFTHRPRPSGCPSGPCPRLQEGEPFAAPFPTHSFPLRSGAAGSADHRLFPFLAKGMFAHRVRCVRIPCVAPAGPLVQATGEMPDGNPMFDANRTGPGRAACRPAPAGGVTAFRPRPVLSRRTFRSALRLIVSCVRPNLQRSAQPLNRSVLTSAPATAGSTTHPLMLPLPVP